MRPGSGGRLCLTERFTAVSRACRYRASISRSHVHCLQAGKKQTEGSGASLPLGRRREDENLPLKYQVSTHPQPVSSVSRKNRDRTSLGPILQDSANPTHGVDPLSDTACRAYHINPYLLHEARFNCNIFVGWGLCRAASDI